MANFGDYPEGFRLLSGDREIRFKIWSLPDLTALMLTGKLATRLQVSRGVLLKILGGVVLSGFQNPNPVFDQKM